MKQQKNYSLLRNNTFGIDAHCRMFTEYETIDELCEVLSDTTLPRPILHIGKGSNLLFTKDYEGTILHSSIKGKTIIEDTEDTILLKVGAGEVWDDFVAWCLDAGYYGIENLSLIPGEVGASAVQNIGAYGTEAEQFIEKVATVSVSDCKERVFKHSECRYTYRDSIFKHECKGRYVVTHVYYRLRKYFKINLTYAALAREIESRGFSPSGITAQQVRDIVIDIRRKKLPDPERLGNAGSFFMNPIVSEIKFSEMLKTYPDIPHYKMSDGIKVPAGWLIQQCGWNGKIFGRAGVYPKQALVLINCGGATGADIIRLSNAICNDVKNKFGIDLKPEVNFI